MDLLVPMPAGNVHAPVTPRGPRRSARFAVGTSVAVHAVLVAAAVLVPAYVPLRDAQEITIDVVDVVAPPEPEAAPPPPPAPRHVVVKRSAPVETAPADPAPAATPTPAEEPTSETAPVVAAESEKTAGDGPPLLVAAIPRAATGGGVPGGVVGGMGRGPAPLSAADRTSMMGRYRNDLLRGRVRDVFRYPPEAKELELEGQVVVQVTVDKTGRLRGARLAGRCPHPILCDDALRTIRAAAPFSPLPAGLGDSLELELPLNYNFQ
jgi:periplasmic protein TonB